MMYSFPQTRDLDLFKVYPNNVQFHSFFTTISQYDFTNLLWTKMNFFYG